MVHGSVDELVGVLSDIENFLEEAGRTWYGVPIQLVSPIKTSQGQVLLQAGTRGKIIQVRRDHDAPFTIQFEGTQISVAPRLDKLKLLS